MQTGDRSRRPWLPALGAMVILAGMLPAQQAEPEQANEDVAVFRTDVNAVRVDVQVLDGNRPVPNLRREDFVLYENGQKQEIRQVSQEEVPLEIVLLLDVSGSMQPHVQAVSDASAEALAHLRKGDRVAIMIFDRRSRLVAPLDGNFDRVENNLARLVQTEDFNGGTDIHLGMQDAARYLQQSARAEGRKAILIVTDDQTEKSRYNPDAVRDLLRSDVVLSAILVRPEFMQGQPSGGNWPSGGGSGGTWPQRRSRWPSGGGGPFGWPFPGGGSPYPGGGGGGPVILGGNLGTGNANTERIAEQTGGDAIRAEHTGSALQDAIYRLRQRYTLVYYSQETNSNGRDVQVQLASATQRRHPGARLSTRQGARTLDADPDRPPVISRRPSQRTPPPPEPEPTPDAVDRAPADDDAPRASNSRGGWRRVEGRPPGPLTPVEPPVNAKPDPATRPADPDVEAEDDAAARRQPTAPAPAKGKWRKVGEPAPAP